MKIKITFDPDGGYGYPKDEIIEGKRLVADYIETLNEVEDADTIAFLKRIEIEKAVDFVAEMWQLNYDVVPMDKIRRCSVCGKLITSGYVWDDIDYFCSEECGAKALGNDEGCLQILVDDGRMVYYDQFPEVCHYRANVNHHHTDCFHYFDNEARMFAWISERIGENVHSFEDCDAWTKRQATSPAHSKGYIEILYIKPKEFYDERRAYVMKLRECEDIMAKAQRTRNDKRLKRLLAEYSFAYDDANWYWGVNPAVWQGEI